MDENTGKPHISESLCIGCGICINKCPHDALIIENLPSEPETDMIHRYSMNGFRLFSIAHAVKGKRGGDSRAQRHGEIDSDQCALRANDSQPRRLVNQEAQWDEVIDSLPKGELRDFFIAVQDGKIRVAVKPQNVDRLPKESREPLLTC